MSDSSGIMIQTKAILMDAYRDLNARKLFWIVMILSCLAMGIFATLGINERGMTFLWMQLNEHHEAAAKLEYKIIFSNVVIGFYLTWVAAILALTSTASIFPDFQTSGSIDLYLSKAIGRGRLFLLKYFAGLLFVTLQVSAFAAASFLVLGLRGQAWEPSLFLAIPIVVLFFSYLYGICVLFGVMTRSTLAALMLTMLAWFFIWGLDSVDRILLAQMQTDAQQRLKANQEMAQAARQIATMERTSNPEENKAELARLRSQRDMYERAAEQTAPSWIPAAENVVFWIKTFVPKTRETTALLDRFLLRNWEYEKSVGRMAERPVRGGPMENDDPTPGRSAWWVIGTSLMFEAVCVGLGLWIFRRRDY